MRGGLTTYHQYLEPQFDIICQSR